MKIRKEELFQLHVLPDQTTFSKTTKKARQKPGQYYLG